MLAFEANSIILGRRDANPENTGAGVRGEREKAVAAEAGVQININIKKGGNNFKIACLEFQFGA
jgi:hypothetical protein